MNSPRISIVIPVLNEATRLQVCLQALQPWRDDGAIIVVDGGSEDDSAALAAPLADRVLRSAPGRALQLNVGAASAGGDYLLFLHADTRLQITPAAMRDILESGPGWGFFRVRLSGADWRFRVIERFMNWRSRITRVATGDQALFVSRQLFDAVGGFANIALMEDVELCKRLREAAPPVVVSVPVTTSSRRWERHGVLRTVALMWYLRLRYWLGADPGQLARWYRGG